MNPENTAYIIEIFKQIKNKQQKIAVAVEGGGLRGIVSASMLKLLDDFGLVDQIQAMSGTSSGAINVAYFLNNDYPSLFELYRKMASRNFIQPWRWPNAMNLDYLFKDEIPNHHPLSLTKIKDRNIPFYVTVTNVESGKSEFMDILHCKNDEEFLSTLKASASAPLFTSNKENIAGRIYNDGHIGLAIPYDKLMDFDVDYVLCLLTRKKGYRKKDNLADRLLSHFALKKYNDNYKASYRRSSDTYNIQLDKIYFDQKVIPIAIEEDDFIVSKMCTDPTEIDQCIASVTQRYSVNEI